MRRRIMSRFVLVTALAAVATPAAADTLREALLAAYRNNPDLNAARADLRVTDEGVEIARANQLPIADLTSAYNENIVQVANGFGQPDRQLSVGPTFSVPIYSGGRLTAARRAARARVTAGRADLRGTESALFSRAVAAYLDVQRDEAIVGLNAANVRVLGVAVQATSDRFEIGDLTRTDVAQSRSRLALAQAQLELAQARLIASREGYLQIVGEAPVALAPPPPLPQLPTSVDTATEIALAQNPDLIAARLATEAGRADARVARAARLPQVSANVAAGYVNFLGSIAAPSINVPINQSTFTVQGGLSLNLPLFTGGLNNARIRQAEARTTATAERQIAVERSVIAQTRSAYASWRASLAAIQSNDTAVSAATLSLEGVRAENTVGNRTVLDILNAEQELLNAQVNLVTARRDAYVAGFTLLAAMGMAEAADLGLEVAAQPNGGLYDPVPLPLSRSERLFDFARIGTVEPVSTRTVDSAPQSADARAVEEPVNRDPIE